MSKSEAARQYRVGVVRMYPYLAEAYLRQVPIPDELVQAIGRNSRMNPGLDLSIQQIDSLFDKTIRSEIKDMTDINF
jgi:hypothetical protein